MLSRFCWVLLYIFWSVILTIVLTIPAEPPCQHCTVYSRGELTRKSRHNTQHNNTDHQTVIFMIRPDHG